MIETVILREIADGLQYSELEGAAEVIRCCAAEIDRLRGAIRDALEIGLEDRSLMRFQLEQALALADAGGEERE